MTRFLRMARNAMIWLLPLLSLASAWISPTVSWVILGIGVATGLSLVPELVRLLWRNRARLTWDLWISGVAFVVALAVGNGWFYTVPESEDFPVRVAEVLTAGVFGGCWANAVLRHGREEFRNRLRAAGLCVRCEYDLTGNVSGVCPECGTPVVPSAGAGERAGTPASERGAATEGRKGSMLGG